MQKVRERRPSFATVVDNFKRRVFALGHKEWKYSSWYFLATCDEQHLGYFHFEKLFFGRMRSFKFLKELFIEFYRFFFGMSPALQWDESRLSRESSVLIWTWLLPGDEALIRQNNSRYFGSLDGFGAKKPLQVFTVVNEHSDAAVQELMRDGHILLVPKRDYLRPLKATAFLLQQICREPRIVLRLFWFINSRYYHSYLLERHFLKILPHFPNLQFLLLPYEGQPEQKKVLAAVKRQTPIKVVGYLHSSIEYFPAEYVYFDEDVDLLLTHGLGYETMVRKSLLWPQTTQTKTIPTLRFRKRAASEFTKSIYLPYSIPNIEFVFEQVSKIIKKYGLTGWTVRPHPVNYPSHIDLKRRLEAVMTDQPQKDITPHVSENFAMVVGDSAVMFECLEAGLKVLQIRFGKENGVFDPELWDDLSVHSESEYVTWYQLRRPGAYIIYPEDGEGFKLSKEYLEKLTTF